MIQENNFFTARDCFAKHLCCLLICFFASGIFSYSQSGYGKLTGKVTDSSTNESLSGVSILAKGTSKGVSTITDGTYIFSLAPGTYAISYSYSGSQKEISGVIIKSGETTFLNILLETSSKLKGIVVTSSSKKESQSSVYSAQKRSAAASDGISFEAIRKTPDNNAGQILTRVTGINVQESRFVVVRGLGDQYNQTMLNGVPMTSTETDRNAFAFDLIPAAVIDNITVNKTATPDMPGNFAGGIVQINTKDFPANDFFSITVGTGFSDQTIGKDFYSDKRGKYEWLGFGGTIRDLPEGFPTSSSRVSFTSLNTQERYRYARMLKNNLAPVNYGPSGLNENVQAGYGKTIKFKNESQLGIVVALNQRKTQLIENEISLRSPSINFTGTSASTENVLGFNYYSENIRYRYSVDLGGVLNLAYRFGNNKVSLKSFYSQIFSNRFINRTYVKTLDFTSLPNGTDRTIGISYLTEQKRILNNILAGEHRTGKNNETRLDWNVNTTLNNTNTPDIRNFLLGTDSARTIFVQDPVNIGLESGLVGFSRLWSATNDFIYGGAFNITTPFNFLSNKQLLKGGILFQNRQRKTTGTVIPINNLPASSSIDSLLSPSNFFPGGGEIVNATSALIGDARNYNAGSSLLAAYESLENRIGNKFRIIWGVRLENYQQHVNVYVPYFFDNFINPDLLIKQFASRTTFNFLPSVNVVYSPSANINVRAAYSNTVIRPELKDITEFLLYDFQTFTLTIGNASLKSTSIQNYDLKLEWFPSSGEILSFSAFYKKILDPIEYGRSNVTDALVKVRMPFNSGEAIVKGLEGEIRKKIDFIPFAPWLSHVTFFGNGTILRSKVPANKLNSYFFPTVNEHHLTGQPNYIVNTGLSIQAFKNSFEITGSFNRTGDYITELGTTDLRFLTNDNQRMLPTLPYFRIKARNLVDIVLTQSLLKNKGRIKLNVSNLLNSRYIIYQDLNGNGKFDRPATIDKSKDYGFNYSGGVDNTASDIRPQRNYSISFSYTF